MIAETPSEFEIRRQTHFDKIASRYPVASVWVGQTSEIWEDYEHNRLYALVCGEECYMQLNSPVEVVTCTQSVYEGRTLVVERSTRRIVGAHTLLY